MAEPVVEVRCDTDCPVPPGWQRIHCEEGTYYWHSATDTSQWDYPTGNPHRHNQRHDYSNVEVSENRMVIEDDLYAEPPYEDLQALQLVSYTGSKPASQKRYENVDVDSQTVQKLRPRPPPRRPGRSSAHSPQRFEIQQKPKRSVPSSASSKQVEIVPKQVEKLYDKPRAAMPSKDYDIPRRSQSPAAAFEQDQHFISSVKSAQLQLDHEASPRNDSHSESHYDVPPTSDVSETELGQAMKEQLHMCVGDRVYDVPPSTRPKPILPKPYKQREGQVSHSVHEKKGKDCPKKPPRRAFSEGKMLISDADSDPLYAEPLDSIVTVRTASSYDKLDGSESQMEASPYNHLGSESPRQTPAHYDRLLTSSSSSPSSPVVKSVCDEYSHLENKGMRNLDEKEKLRRLKEEKRKRHRYEDVDREFDVEMEQRVHDYEDLSDDETVEQGDREVVVGQEVAESREYEDLSDHKLFGLNGGGGETAKLKQNHGKHQKYEDVADELAWDNTPIEAALRATQSPKPSADSSLSNSSSPSNTSQDVYAVVEQKKKKSVGVSKEELPEGWEVVNDGERMYYWHVPTGATQWERPMVGTTQGIKHHGLEERPPPVPVKTDGANVLVAAVQSSATNVDADVGLATRLEELKTADMKYSSINIGGSSPNMRRQLNRSSESVDGVQTFTAVSLGWVELEESQLLGGKGSTAVSDSIRHITQGVTITREGNQVVTGHLWGQEKSLYLQIHGIILKVIDADDKKNLMTQSIAGIRLFGSGRDLGHHFAFVARDKVTHRHRCHVFRCDVPGRSVVMALEAVCNKAMKEREERKRQEQREEAGHVGRRLAQLGNVGVPTQQEKKTFVATYLGRTDAPKGTDVEVIHNAIEKLKSCNPRTWQEVVIEVMPSSVRLVDQKTQQVVQEHRVSFLSFLALGKDKRYCAYIMSPSREIHWCHAFASEVSSGALTRAIQDACSTRYQSVLESRQGLQQSSPEKTKAVAGTNFLKSTATSAAAGGVVSQIQASSTASGVSADSADGSQTETKSMRGTLRSLITKLDPRRSTKRTDKSMQSEVSTYLHYMGSENVRSRDLDLKEGINGAMRRLRNSQFVLACQCVVSGSHITLIDSQRRSFSKRLFPLSSIVYCEQDQDVFAFITNKDKIHVCHVFTKMGKCDIDAVCQAILMRSKQSSNP